MTRRWREYFERTVGDLRLLEYAAEHWGYNRRLYSKIRKVVPPPAAVLEVGCGYGLSAIYLHECGYRVTAVDNDEAIVELARHNARQLQSDVRIELADASALHAFHGLFDLTFSVGVVEHFDRPVTVDLLREQALCARFVLAVVPSRYTKYTGTITDERIYTLGGLRRMFRDAGLLEVSVFGYGDVPSPFHRIVRACLPLGLYYILQDRFSYCPSLGCVGRSPAFKTASHVC